jgi:hypothetical protein
MVRIINKLGITVRAKRQSRTKTTKAKRGEKKIFEKA